ncbi:hypothetical protein [Arthrospira platensis]|jgi:hypothetical protein|uniref:Uncharacterized protein n=1 Tax=Limnospira platensis NIES-46 TaxID=1236695 RepID=A0A5M3TDT8_LIMPL|nr:hypothetical protein [Arthrospira platensis]AMW29883.1 hypothetical protein AP285_20050 [Arthrospira platensis YZ]KDR54268.1 hypothetical protein APPUASWS_029805 [Arthrospira platensis str. Paraca]MBD2671904.1 hypothetical protein [Arthrospira platensis FACHB-439]MBD2712954.1 hypothetical protein [Arthrospira platensis FACHB-835]MDF2212087.1 hypothetical protein [Arthrospira platensis NCB002]MDT9184191.1 hypothetical protein [Limnospira sp. PMC 289.06]MDT9297699.1 hypothetical protein [Ar
MVKPTSFNLEDAECLLRQLDQFRGTLQQEWGKVATQWENIKLTWHDQQFDKFAPLFEKLSSTYQGEIDGCEKYMGFLVQQIKTAEQRKVKLGDVVNKLYTGVEIAQAIVGLGYASPPSEIAMSSAKPISSIEQQEEDKTDYDFARIDRVPNIEDQLAESFKTSQENERKRRQEELEKNHNPQNSHSQPK